MKFQLIILTVMSLAIGPLCRTVSAQAQPYSPAQDSMFKEPFVEMDEWRDFPVRHHYVHGGFKGTDTKFSFYFPEKSGYHQRFFQHITPVPDNENLAQKVVSEEENKIGFAFESGGYFVETNGGGAKISGPAIQPSQPTVLTLRQQIIRGWWRQKYTRRIGLTVTLTVAAAAPIEPSVLSKTRTECGMAWFPTSSDRQWPCRMCSPCASTLCEYFGASFRRSSMQWMQAVS